MTEPLLTPFYQAHLDAGAKMVDFAGYCLPINYGSQIKEHEAVRNDAGMFDVSHMVTTDIRGDKAKVWLRYILANDVEKLDTVGKALYSAILNEQGGILDDMIVYLTNFGYRTVSNAATREKDLAWFAKTSEKFDINLTVRDDLAILAVQGPNAIKKVINVYPDWSEKIHALKPFVGTYVDAKGDFFVARTGYTGEDGIEIMFPKEYAISVFNELKAGGIQPCGLGARDTLRLEAGMDLYGHDMDENVSPYEAGIGWMVSLTNDRDFIGKSALLKQKEAGIAVKQVGLVLNDKGVLRDGMKVIIDGVGEGVITSGSFSPTLGCSIAIARVPIATKDSALVDIRGKLIPVRVIRLPFIRNGKKMFA